jgi:hypothetical protein
LKPNIAWWFSISGCYTVAPNALTSSQLPGAPCATPRTFETNAVARAAELCPEVHPNLLKLKGLASPRCQASFDRKCLAQLSCLTNLLARALYPVELSLFSLRQASWMWHEILQEMQHCPILHVRFKIMAEQPIGLSKPRCPICGEYNENGSASK